MITGVRHKSVMERERNMNNFTYYIETKIHFGKGQIEHLSELSAYGSKVLLVYGGGSIKKIGVYDKALEILKDAGLEVFELSGVEPNPRISSVRAGAAICKEKGVDMVLAVGGGSAIDCAKVIAGAALYEGDAWDLVINPGKIGKVLPIFCVLTMAATGTEMNIHAVISDPEKNEKWGTGSEAFKPRMSICDPEYSYTVPKFQTAAGVADIMSHTMENYFTRVEDAFIQARFAEAILKTCIKYGPIALEKPCDYEARANIMWASTHAINGLIKKGAEVPWCIHPMGHEISAFYDVTHGVSLSVITPFWMEYILSDERAAKKLAEYGVNVWGLNPDGDSKETARRAATLTREFFTKKLGLPGTLREAGVADESHFEEMADKITGRTKDAFVSLSKEDIIAIYKAAF